MKRTRDSWSVISIKLRVRPNIKEFNPIFSSNYYIMFPLLLWSMLGRTNEFRETYIQKIVVSINSFSKNVKILCTDDSHVSYLGNYYMAFNRKIRTVSTYFFYHPMMINHPIL